MKRRVKNTKSARTMRRATAYARLYEKAMRAGNHREASRYHEMRMRFLAQAQRERAREEASATARATSPFREELR